MPKIGELFIDITANNSKLRANLAEASSLIRDWSLLVTGITGGITNAFNMVAGVAIKGIQVAIIGLIGTFTLAATSGANFEDAMVRAFTVLKENASDAASGFMSLTNAARRLGRDTLYSATQAAQGMEILAKAGFDTKEIIDSIRPALNLAIVGNLELADAAQFTVNALRGFNLETEDAGRVADVLALGASQAATNIQELGTAMSFVAPVAAGVGMSIEETVATLDVLANRGIRASKAGTTLRRALTQLVAPTGRAKKLMSQLGLSFVDTSGNIKPMVTIIKQLNAAGITAAQTMEMFGLRAGPGMIALLKAGSSAIEELETKLNNANGASERMAQNFRTTVKGRVMDLKASIVDLGLGFSENFKKPLADAIFAVRNFLVSIVNTGERMGTFKAFIKGVGIVLKPVLSLIEEGASAFKRFLANLTPSDILGFFERLGQKVSMFIEALTNGELGETLSELFGMLKSIAGGIHGLIKGIIYLWKLIPRNVRPAITAIGLLVVGFIQLFGGILNVIIFIISMNALLGVAAAKIGLAAGSLSLWPIIGGAVLLVFKAIAVILGVIVGLYLTIKFWKWVFELEGVQNILQAIANLLSTAWDYVKKIWDWAGSEDSPFKPLVDGINFVINKLGGLKDAFKQAWDFINNLGKQEDKKEVRHAGPRLAKKGKGPEQLVSDGVDLAGSLMYGTKKGIGSSFMGVNMDFSKGVHLTVEQIKNNMKNAEVMSDNVTSMLGYMQEVNTFLEKVSTRAQSQKSEVMRLREKMNSLERQHIKPDNATLNRPSSGSGLSIQQ